MDLVPLACEDGDFVQDITKLTIIKLVSLKITSMYFLCEFYSSFIYFLCLFLFFQVSLLRFRQLTMSLRYPYCPGISRSNACPRYSDGDRCSMVFHGFE